MSGFVLTYSSSNQSEYTETIDKIIQNLHIHDWKTFRYYAFFKNRENLRSFLEVLFKQIDIKTKKDNQIITTLNTIFKKRDSLKLLEACLIIYNSFDFIGIDLLKYIIKKADNQITNLFCILDNLGVIKNPADIANLLKTKTKTKNFTRLGVKIDKCFDMIKEFSEQNNLIFAKDLKHFDDANEKLAILESIAATNDNKLYDRKFIDAQINEAKSLLETDIQEVMKKRTSYSVIIKSSLNTAKSSSVFNSKKRTRKSIENPSKQLYTPEKNNLNKDDLSSNSSLIFSNPAKKPNTCGSIEEMLNSPLLPALDSPRDKITANVGGIEINLFNDNDNVNTSNLLLKY